MKKIILFLSILLFSISVNASEFIVSVTCPTSESPNAIVSCVIKSTYDGFKLRGFQTSYEIENATFDSFTVGSGFNATLVKEYGISLDRSVSISSPATIGTLKIKMPASGSAHISFSNIVATDESNTNTYEALDIEKTIKVKSNVNTLSSITISSGVLSPSFSSNVTSYSATVSVPKITINATPTDECAKVTGTGTKSLNYGKNTYKIVVTSETGTTKTYTLNITRIDNRDSDNTLSDLSVENYNISPEFTSSNSTYTLKVDGNASSIKINATKSSSKSSFVSGYGPREVKLNYGENKVNIKVKSENEVIKTYTINVTRIDTRSKINTLSSLSVDSYTLSPSFSESTLSYTLKVPDNISKVKVSAVKKSDKASFVSGYGPREVTLKSGINTIEIKVKSESESVKTYTIKVTREDNRSNNNYLKTLEIVGYNINFNKTTYSYSLVVKNNVSSIKINAIQEDTKATINLKDNYDLKVGLNEIKINVKAQNDEVKTYILNITRLDKENITSSNKNITSLTIDDYDVEFNKDIFEYSITIENEEKLNFNYTLEEPTTTVSIENNENLKDGSVIKLKVKSSDSSELEYKFVISKIDNNEQPIISPKPVKLDKHREIKLISGIVSVVIIVLCFMVFTIININRKVMQWK